MNPYVNFVLPNVRVVAQLFKKMTPEEASAFREHHHLLFYNLEDLVSSLAIVDESAASHRRDLAAARRALAELDE